MSTRWYQEKKREHYYKEAKRVGYRARSAFKLQQIQGKFHIIKHGDLVIDLGASPGGWSQVAQEYVGDHGQVVGVDISSTKPLDRVFFIQGDISDQVTIEQITEFLAGRKADAVISDMSPDISGSYSIDQARSAWLCEQAFAVAQQMLRPGGNFVCKIFEGEDLKEFLDLVKPFFTFVKQFSPEASRKSSSEVYIVLKGFHAPVESE